MCLSTQRGACSHPTGRPTVPYWCTIDVRTPWARHGVPTGPPSGPDGRPAARRRHRPADFHRRPPVWAARISAQAGAIVEMTCKKTKSQAPDAPRPGMRRQGILQRPCGNVSLSLTNSTRGAHKKTALDLPVGFGAARVVPEARKWPRHARGSSRRSWRPLWTHFASLSMI